MTAICSVGLDIDVILRDTHLATTAAMIADEAANALRTRKTTAVRIILMVRKVTCWNPEVLWHAPVMKVNKNTAVILARWSNPARSQL